MSSPSPVASLISITLENDYNEAKVKSAATRYQDKNNQKGSEQSGQFSEQKMRNFQEDSRPPLDKYNIFYWIIFFQGLASNFPWNALLTAQSYFTVRLESSNLGSEFTVHFAIIFKLLKLAVFALVTVLASKGGRMRSGLLISMASTGNVLVFSALTMMVGWQAIEVDHFYLLTLGLVFMAALFVALFESGMYTLLGSFPGKMTQAFLAGHSVGGILAALNIILTFYWMDSTNVFSTTKAYFTLSVAIFIVGIMLYFVMINMDFFKFYKKKSAMYTVIKQHQSDELIAAAGADQKNQSDRELTIRDLIFKLWEPSISTILLGFTNLIINPTLVSITVSTALTSGAQPIALQTHLFVPVAFLVSSTADLLGKVLALFPDLLIPAEFSPNSFITFSITRLAFIPAFLLGNIRIKGQPLKLPAVLSSDLLFFILLFCVFLTSGYLGTVMMLQGAKKVPVSARGRANVLLGTFSLFGVLLGAVCSLFLKIFLKTYLV